jgi:hypothetical protein
LGYGTDCVDNRRAALVGSSSFLAAQQELGLWTEWGTGIGSGDRFDTCPIESVLRTDRTFWN